MTSNGVDGDRIDDEEDEDDENSADGSRTAKIVFVDINRLKRNILHESSSTPSLPPPPPIRPSSRLPINSFSSACALKVAQRNPQLSTEDRQKPGVEKPGTSSTSSSSSPSEDAESRSDGSDSGLGSELLLNVNAPPPPSCDQQNISQEISSLSLPSVPPPPEEILEDSILKSSSVVPSSPSHPPLLYEDVEVDEVDFQELAAQSPLPLLFPPQPPRSALKRASLEDTSHAATDSKRPRRTVQFENVTIYYFARIQGFLCVPSVGGCTLGMESRHMYEKSMTLNEHLAEQRRAHRMTQMEQLSPNFTRSQGATPTAMTSTISTVSGAPSSSDDSDDDGSSASSDVDAELAGFLRPVSTKQRRVLLKAAGIRKIEPSEKDECRVIRTSREVCGCRCQGYCDPELCYCSVNGIKCQVDRTSFPCSCTGDSCGNTVGRVEFNPMRVRTHFIHTIMRLELEKKPEPGEQEEEQAERKTASGRSRLSIDINRSSRDFVDYSRPFENSLATQSYHHHHHLPQSPVLPPLSVLMSSSSMTAGEGDNLILSGKSMVDDGEYGYSRREEVTEVSNNNEDRLVSHSSPSKAASSGSQFCNNILQILGIQSTPSPPQKVASPLPTSPPLKDYSPRNGGLEKDFVEASPIKSPLFSSDRSSSSEPLKSIAVIDGPTGVVDVALPVLNGVATSATMTSLSDSECSPVGIIVPTAEVVAGEQQSKGGVVERVEVEVTDESWK